MYYVGVDFHKNYSVATIMDQHGNIVKRLRFLNTEEAINDFARSIPPGSHLAFEATFNWYFFYEILEQYPIHIFLAHPLKTRLIAEAKIKTDKIDSTTLAHLLRTNFLPTSYIPPKYIRDLRELLRLRASLVSLRTSLKNCIRTVLSKRGLSCPYSNILGKKAVNFLKNLNLPEPYNTELLFYLLLAESSNNLISQLSPIIKDMAQNNSDAMLLTSIPGISYFSALLIVAEIGDISRFSSPKKLASFAGLVPSVRSSDGKSTHGPITKQGSKWLRWILVELSHHFTNASPGLNRIFRNVSSKHGVHKARVAVAREMLTIIFHMLTDKRTFRYHP